jgi:hypothetical protein
MTRRAAGVVGAATFALGILAVATIGSLIGLNAECNGAAGECPRSDAYRWTLLLSPVAVLAILVAAAIVSVRRRSVRPLLLACGAAIVLEYAADSALRL